MQYAKKQIRDFIIADHQDINPEFFKIKVRSENDFDTIYPGQFAEVLVPNSKEAFLRRPLSVHNVNYKENIIEFLIQIVGEGTKALKELKPGDKLNIIFPLGNSFTTPEVDEQVLLIGGGCGVAPLLLMAKTIHEKGNKPHILIGGRNVDYLLDFEAYKQYGHVYTTTEDGSHGEKGFVIHHSVLWKSDIPFRRIYSCGPEAMLQAVAKYAKKKNIFCEVSLENTMACGIGSCLSCVTDTIYGHQRVCKEGPVFNTNVLKW